MLYKEFRSCSKVHLHQRDRHFKCPSNVWLWQWFPVYNNFTQLVFWNSVTHLVGQNTNNNNNIKIKLGLWTKWILFVKVVNIQYLYFSCCQKIPQKIFCPFLSTYLLSLWHSVLNSLIPNEDRMKQNEWKHHLMWNTS